MPHSARGNRLSSALSFSSLSLLTFCRTKSYKKARHKLSKSFKALARELLCNITHPPFTCRSCLNVPISGTKELASRTACIVWRTRSNTFVLIPLLELTRAVAQHHAGFIFKITLVRKMYCPSVLGAFFCLFIDSFCDLCPTRHHKRGASRDHSQQNSSIALLLSPCFRGDERLASEGVIVWRRPTCLPHTFSTL